MEIPSRAIEAHLERLAGDYQERLQDFTLDVELDEDGDITLRLKAISTFELRRVLWCALAEGDVVGIVELDGGGELEAGEAREFAVALDDAQCAELDISVIADDVLHNLQRRFERRGDQLIVTAPLAECFANQELATPRVWPVTTKTMAPSDFLDPPSYSERLSGMFLDVRVQDDGEVALRLTAEKHVELRSATWRRVHEGDSQPTAFRDEAVSFGRGESRNYSLRLDADERAALVITFVENGTNRTVQRCFQRSGAAFITTEGSPR